MNMLRSLLVGALATLSVATTGCADVDEVPADVVERVEGAWRLSGSGTTFAVTVGERGKDCKEMGDCEMADSATLSIAVDSPTCGRALLYGTVAWGEGGKLTVGFRSTLAYGASGELVDGVLTLRDTSSGIGVKIDASTCVWKELGSSATLTR